MAIVYHRTSIAMNFYNDMSPEKQAEFRSFVATQPPTPENRAVLFSLQNPGSSYSNYNQASSVYGYSNTMGMHNNPFNQAVNFNEAYRNSLLKPGLSLLSSAELTKRKEFANSVRDLQLAGNIAELKSLYEKITQEKSSFWKIRQMKHINRQWRLDQLEKIISDPVTMRLYTIKYGNFQAAIKAFNEFPLAGFFPRSSLGGDIGKITTTVPEGQTSKVFDRSQLPAEFQAGLQMLNARSDYQAYMKAQQEQYMQSLSPVSPSTPPIEISPEQTTASTIYTPGHSTQSAVVSAVESLFPLDDIVLEVQSVAKSSEVRQKLVAAKHVLLNNSSSSSSSADVYFEKQVKFIDMLLDGTLAEQLSVLQHTDYRTAVTMYEQLTGLWPWLHEHTFLVRDINEAEMAFIKTIGIDIIAAVESHVLTRAENIMGANISNQVDGYLSECLLWQMQGDMTNLKAEQARLKAQLLSGSKELLPAVQYIAIERILHDPLTDGLCTIVHGDLTMAKTAFHSIEADVHKYIERDCDFSTMSEARAAMEREKGFDVLKAAHSCYQARPDFPGLPVQLQPLNDELMTMLTNIKKADFSVATTEYAALKEQLANNLQQADIQDAEAKDFILEHIGFDALEVATALYQARSEYQAQQGQGLDGYQPLAVSAIPKEIRSVRAGMLEALNQSTNQVQLADTIDGVRREVFGLAQYHNYEIHPEVYDQVHISIGIIRVTGHVHEIVFHVAIVDRVLGDIQAQVTGQQAQHQPTLLERSPELLVHGLKKFIQGLNPITQIKNGVEFWVGTAHFVADITIGEFYLTPEQYQARKDGFWQSVEAFYPANLAQLSAEQWVEMGAQMAADFVYAKGVAGTLAYLKEIDAMSRAQRRVVRLAEKFKEGFDKVLGKEPIVVTPEGIIWKASSECEELMSFQKNTSKASGGAREVIKDSNKVASTLEKEAARGNKITQVGKHEVPHGLYESSPKHHPNVRGHISPAPKNGQKALNNSLPFKSNKRSRIAICDGEFVVLMEHRPGLFHGHTRPWNELEPAMQKALRDAGLVTKSGKIKK